MSKVNVRALPKFQECCPLFEELDDFSCDFLLTLPSDALTPMHHTRGTVITLGSIEDIRSLLFQLVDATDNLDVSRDDVEAWYQETLSERSRNCTFSRRKELTA